MDVKLVDRYTLFEWIPYEGYSEIVEGTLEECRNKAKEFVSKPFQYKYDLLLLSNNAPSIEELLK